MSEIISIPAEVSGVDWSRKSFVTSAPTGSHEANTLIDISGSGYLICITGPSGTVIYGLQIDDGSIYKLQTYTNGGSFSLNPIRFNNSCKVTASVSNSDSVHVWVVLD